MPFPRRPHLLQILAQLCRHVHLPVLSEIPDGLQEGVAAVYLFAFASLYTQIPGLYGPEGILPARRTLRPQGKGLWQQLWETPTLLWEAPRLGLDTAQGLDLLTLLGTVLALGALLLNSLRHPFVYLLLWVAYRSAYQVGQVFLYFQWDSLLLETGFLAILVAPLRGPSKHKILQGRLAGALPHEDLPFWLVRWLLFRLMFASGVVKLTSRCPTWWGLTALTYHYETQCLPTPAAWFAHHLPVWLHKLSVVATFLIEIAVPPLFFAPIRRLRLTAFYAQALLQVLIIITGNYNFFNLLTLVLTTALLDDRHLSAEPGTHGRLWTGAHRLFGSVEHLQLANSYGLFRRMTGVGGRPEVVLEGSYDGQHWTEIEFMYKPGNVSRPPPFLTPHQPRLDWQMWFAALGPHTHSPWFTGLVLRLLQGKEPVIRLVQSHVANYPFHERPPTYLRAQRYKYWFSKPGDQSRWWHRQWVEEFFPSVSLGDPTLETLLQQFGLKDKSPPRARSPSNGLAQTLNWVRTQLSPLEPPILLWGLFGAVVAIRVVQTLLAPRPLQSSKQTREEKRKQTSKKDSRAASEQAAANSNSRDSWAPRRKK